MGLGNPPGSTGWKYHAPPTSDLCRVVLKAKHIKIACKNDPSYALTPPYAGSMGVVLTVGDQRYCAEFGGTTVQNDASGFKRKNAPAPAACPTPVCGQFETEWGTQGSGAGQFAAPTYMALDSGSNAYVVDLFNFRVQKFSSTGTFLTAWGSLGTGDGQFDGPTGIAVDGGGNVYVGDYDHDRIEKFTASGTFLLKWGSLGTGDGQFEGPEGVAVDGSGNVYVTEIGNTSRIQKFSSSGTFLLKWGSAGSGDGQFQQPNGIAVDLASGDVYVADTENARIQKFTSTGTFLLKWGSAGSGDGQFNSPFGIAVDGSGNVYVSDGNDRVQEFTSTGAFVAKWGLFGSPAYGNFSAGRFDAPAGIAVDAGGHVYVVDSFNYRVERFGCP